MFRKENDGGYDLSQYISYKGIYNWNISIAYKQKSPNTISYIQVRKKNSNKISKIEHDKTEYALGDRLLAVKHFRERLLEHCPIKQVIIKFSKKLNFKFYKI